MLVYWAAVIAGPFLFPVIARLVPNKPRWSYLLATVFLAWLVFVLGAAGPWWGGILND